MKTQDPNQHGAGATQLLGASYSSQRNEGIDLRVMEAARTSGLHTSHPGRQVVALNYHESCDKDVANFLQSTYQQDRPSSPMSAEETVVMTADPMVTILAAFYSIPPDYLVDLFNDFQEAAGVRDLRRLLDTISDWSATAELYAHSSLATDLQDAIGGRKGVADWLHG